MSDHYIEQAQVQEANFQDYIVLLSKPTGAFKKAVDFLAPSLSYQIVIYTNDKKQIYVAKVSITGKFTKAILMQGFTLVCKSKKTISLQFEQLNINGDFDVSRHGNKTVFNSEEEFLEYLVNNSK